MGAHDTDRKVGNNTLTIQKQELQVVFRVANRNYFDGALPEPFFFADRTYPAGSPVYWYLWPSRVDPKRKRPSIRFSYDDVMSAERHRTVVNDVRREIVQHWRHFTGRSMVRDIEFWRKAIEIGFNTDLLTFGVLPGESSPDLEGLERPWEALLARPAE